MRERNRQDHPDIVALVDALTLMGVKSGLTEQQARDSIKVVWAYNRITGKELGKAPPGAREAAEADWANPPLQCDAAPTPKYRGA